MHGRLEKIIGKLTKGGKVHHEVSEAFTRVLLELRGRGEELFHLVGWEGPVQHQGPKKRREFSIALLIPDPEEPSRHRVLAEVMVHCADAGRHRGMIENVAVRYAEDWEDWTVVKDFDYFKLNAPSPERVRLGEEGAMTGKEVHAKIWERVMQLLNGHAAGSKKDFGQRLGRVVERITGDGELLTGFEVEMVYRTTKTGSKGKTMAAARIALFARPSKSINEPLVKDLERLDIKEDKVVTEELQPGISGGRIFNKQIRDEDHIAAVIVIDLSTPADGQYKVKHIAVIYEGEWPITHHYRKAIPPPSMAGLEHLLEADKLVNV